MIVAACGAALIGAILTVLLVEQPTASGIAIVMAFSACVGVVLHAAFS